VIGAANDDSEPNPAIAISCCARTQHKKCRMCEISGAIAQQKDRPFLNIAARMKLVTRAARWLPQQVLLCRFGIDLPFRTLN
jgi:hypothetical protein